MHSDDLLKEVVDGAGFENFVEGTCSDSHHEGRHDPKPAMSLGPTARAHAFNIERS